MEEVFFLLRGVFENILEEISHLIRNKMVPAARVGLSLILKHRAGKAIFEFMGRSGPAMFSAQGILHTPARHVPFAISRAEGFITSELLPAQDRHRPLWIVYQWRGILVKKKFRLNVSPNFSFPMIQYQRESCRSLSRPIRRSIAPLRRCRRECRDWHR